MLESEQIQRDQGREKLIQAERRSHSITNELEESKTQLELADRQRRAAEQELSDVVEQLSDQSLQNQALEAAKRKLDSEIQTLQASFSIKANFFVLSSYSPYYSGRSGGDGLREHGGRGEGQEVDD